MIKALENGLEVLQNEMSLPEYFNQDKQAISTDPLKLSAFSSELEQAYARREKLEEGS